VLDIDGEAEDKRVQKMLRAMDIIPAGRGLLIAGYNATFTVSQPIKLQVSGKKMLTVKSPRKLDWMNNN
jgi:hypothetical protein